MRLVNDLGEVLDNIALLEEVRRGTQPRNEATYRSLIKRGTCFVPHLAADRLTFAPSRFIGYAHNSFPKHAANEQRDGRQTNDALNVILESQPVQDSGLERLYHEFCKAIGVTPSETGSFGVARKFWVTPEIADHLDRLAEAEVVADPTLAQTEKERIVKSRIGQGAFRDELLAKWKRCCMSGCEIVSILRASHIKPWRASSNAERLDVFNGLLLSPNMDVLFDKGFISFEDDGSLLLSRAITHAALIALGCQPNLKLKLDRRHAVYLKHHRSEVFAKRSLNGGAACRYVTDSAATA